MSCRRIERASPVEAENATDSSWYEYFLGSTPTPSFAPSLAKLKLEAAPVALEAPPLEGLRGVGGVDAPPAAPPAAPPVAPVGCGAVEVNGKWVNIVNSSTVAGG